MPQFVLNTPARKAAKPHPFYALSDFAKGYVEAMFFTNGDTGDDREDLLNEWGVECLTHEAVKSIAADCDKFLSTLMPDGCFARQWIDRLAAFPATFGDGVKDDARAGNMFWYARQGHGVGWSDDYGGLKAMATADGLQEASRRFGEATVEAYRKRIHHR